MGSRNSSTASKNNTSLSSSNNRGSFSPSEPTSKASDIEEDPINESAQNIEAKQTLQVDLDSLLSCSVSSKNSYLKLSASESQKLPVLFNIKTQEEAGKNAISDDYRPPIDLFCVIDRSGSMSGTKIQLVRETLNYLISILTPNDRLSLIVFDDKADVLTGLKRVSKENQLFFQSKIDIIHDRGGTNMMIGLTRALELMQSRKSKNKVTSLFLLSDGLDNIGNVDENFKRKIEEMKLQDLFTMNTFGFGNDHDPESMRKLANLKDGNFYYIEKLDQVDEYFVSALAGLLSVIGERFLMKVSAVTKPPFTDLRISKVYGTQWKLDENDESYSFTMNQLWLGISKELMMEINVPPTKKKIEDEQRSVILVKAHIEVDSITEKKTIKRELELPLTLYNQEEEVPGEKLVVNQEVMKNYLRVQGAEVIKEARSLADKGKFDESKKIIQDNLKSFEAEEYKQDQKLQVLANDMKTIQELCTPNEYESKGKKIMMQQEMFHVEQRCNNLSSQAYEDLYCNKVEKKMLSSLRSKKK